MLPPGVAPSAAYKVQSNQDQAATPQVGPEAQRQDVSALAALRPIGSDSTTNPELLRLSGEMRLAQSVSVFAETVGSLLKIPRRDGEALTDYSKRLAVAIANLGQEERTRLQAQLNRIMQGATLRLLTELLMSPAGPAAARLAVQIETAQYRERDLAARQVVSSYRQNEAAPQPANTNANVTPGAQTDAKAAGDTGKPSLPTVSQTEVKNAAATTGTGDIAPGSVAVIDEAETVEGNDARSEVSAHTSEDTPEVAQGTENLQASSSDAAETPSALESPPEIPTQFSGQSDADPAATAALLQETSTSPTTGEPIVSEGASPPSSSLETSDPASVSKTAIADETVYDAGTLVRLASGEDRTADGKTPHVTPAKIFIAEWVAETLAASPEIREARSARSDNTPALLSAGGQPLDPAPEEAAPRSLAPKMTGQAAMTISSEPAQASPRSAAASFTTLQPLASVALSSLADEEMPGSMLPAIALAAREPVGFGFVPYASVPAYENRQSREVKRKPPLDGEQQQPRREHDDQHASGKKQQAPQMAEEPQQEEPLPENEMSLSGRNDLPAAVAAEVENSVLALGQSAGTQMPFELASNAADFYRSLAGWE